MGAVQVVVKDRATGTVLASGREGAQVLRLEGNWYFAPAAVAENLLVRTDRTYTCPYKGVCHWIDLVEGEQRTPNVAWVYEQPKAGFEQIRGRYGFSSVRRTLEVTSDE